MTIMTIEEMTKQKKNLLLIHWSSFAGMSATFSVYLFSKEVFKGMDPRVSLIALFFAFVFCFCSLFHHKKAKKMEKKIENQQEMFTLLEKGGDSLLKDLYSLEQEGYQVLEFVKWYSDGKYFKPYKEYVKLKYSEAQDRFCIRKRLLNGNLVIEMAEELLAIEALPTGRLVMLEMKWDLSG